MISKWRVKKMNVLYTDIFNESCYAYYRNDSLDHTVIPL